MHKTVVDGVRNAGKDVLAAVVTGRGSCWPGEDSLSSARTASPRQVSDVSLESPACVVRRFCNMRRDVLSVGNYPRALPDGKASDVTARQRLFRDERRGVKLS